MNLAIYGAMTSFAYNLILIIVMDGGNIVCFNCKTAYGKLGSGKEPRVLICGDSFCN